MKYQVIEAGTTLALTSEVNKAIRLGWKPLGGICVVVAKNSVIYHQAMTKG